MNIAFFVGSFPSISETFILRQVTGLIDLGHNVDIYAEGRPATNEAIHQDVLKYKLLEQTFYLSDHMPLPSIYEMPVWPVDEDTWLPGSEEGISNSDRIKDAAPVMMDLLSDYPVNVFEVLDQHRYGIEAKSLSSLYRLNALTKLNKKYDVLHAHFGPVGNTFRFTRNFYKAPFIVTFHGYDMCTFPRQHGQRIYDDLFKISDVVTAHSDYAWNLLVQLGCSSNLLRQLHVGVNLDNFRYKERSLSTGEKLRILTVARLVEIKGLDYSIRAIAEVEKQINNIQYLIIGEGPEREKLEQLITELNLSHVVQLLGAKDSGYVQQKMDEAHLFLLPSIDLNSDQEGTPVSLMEAQAAGLPVISTKTGGIPEVIVDGTSGLLARDKDVLDLSAKVLTVVNNRDSWIQMGRIGRRHVEENYNIDQLNLQLVEIYEAAIKNFHQHK